jgi:hypothetical protein
VSLAARFWIYQRERFPLLSHGFLVAVVTVGALGYVAGSGSSLQGLGVASALAALLSTLGFFFQLRVADEYKDYAADAQYRAYRPVPRGVIQLHELAWLALGVALVQLLMALSRDMRLLPYLMAVWGYMFLMRYEFFVHAWLAARPLLYMLSHMVVLPLIFLYLAAWHFVPAQNALPPGLLWLLVAAFANGMVFEIGRKLRAPEQEERGVETYSGLWGISRGALAWTASVGLAAVAALAALWVVQAGIGAAMLIMGGTLAMVVIAALYARTPTLSYAKWVEQGSAYWMILCYLTLGVAPWMGR